MKNSFSLSIPSRCTEKWDNFTPAAQGGFCASCSKVVVDFTRMSDADIIAFFSEKRSHTCGRFRADQLKDYAALAPLKINPGFTLLKASLMSLFFLLVSKQNYAQGATTPTTIERVQHVDEAAKDAASVGSDHTVSGIVKSRDNESPIPGVSVILKGTVYGTVTDSEGRFQFPQPLQEGDVLVFNFIGYETKEYTIHQTGSDALEIPMVLMAIEMLGEIAVNDPYETQPSGFQRLWWKIKNIF